MDTGIYVYIRKHLQKHIYNNYKCICYKNLNSESENFPLTEETEEGGEKREKGGRGTVLLAILSIKKISNKFSAVVNLLKKLITVFQNSINRDSWLAQSVEHATLDIRVVSLSPTLAVKMS